MAHRLADFKHQSVWTGLCERGVVRAASLTMSVSAPLAKMAQAVVRVPQRHIRCLATGARVPQNLVEKIVQRHAVDLEPGHVVRAGDFVSVRPAYVMTHDNTSAVMGKFKELKTATFANPRQVVFTLDHNVQDKSEKNLAKYRSIEAFAKSNGIDFYPAGRGIGHQVMCEEGYAYPHTMVVASDSHSNMYGGIGCLGTPVVRTDAAAIWATTKTWWQVPPVAKVVLTGQLQPGVTGKDVIVTLCGHFNKDEVLNHAVEFDGPGVAGLSIDDRLTVANMTTEWGALAGIFPADGVLLDWLERRVDTVAKRGLAGVPSDADAGGMNPRLNKERLQATRAAAQTMQADPGAFYAKTLTLDLATVRPHASGPNHVKKMSTINELAAKNIKIQKAYLVSCVNSRLGDIAAAAEVIKGKKVAEGVQFYVAAASSEVQQQAEAQGHWQTLLEAGARPLLPGCGPCIGLGVGLLEDGEVGISATNRNFKGRMGSRNAEAYLASPAVVAASAVAGHICAPASMQDVPLKATITTHTPHVGDAPAVTLRQGFPQELKGAILLCPQDNINTDGIYPGKYTYREDISPSEMAKVAMENYDPNFQQLVREGDLLVGGYNFGTGSSREQAATALKYAGIKLLLAGSFSETYKRNAINNGVLVLEVPELVNDLKEQLGTSAPTIRSPSDAHVDFVASCITYNGKRYAMSPVGAIAQELVLAGGLEAWIKLQLQAKQ